MDDEKSMAAGQSGGVNISGGNVSVGGDIVGHDKIVGTQISNAQLDRTFQLLEQAVAQNEEAKQKVEALKAEAAKGNKANDGVMAGLLEGILKLVPGAVSAVASAFGRPLLAGIAGPVTKYVLGKFQEK